MTSDLLSALGICMILVITCPGYGAVYIRPKGPTTRRLNINDSTIIEWKVLDDDRQSDVRSGHLVFRRDVTVLSDYNLDTRKRSNATIDESDPNLQPSSTEIGVHGYRISRVQPRYAGEYSCTYREYFGLPEHTAINNITLFVYAPPTKPVIVPQTPIQKGRDVSFRCVTQSQSEPAYLRPEMVITWTRGGNQISTSRYSVDGDTLTISKIDDRDQGVELRCTGAENGSSVRAASDTFTIVLISIQDVDMSDSDAAVEGATTRLAWRILGTVDPPPEYNHSLVFSVNGRDLAEYNLRYRHWEPDTSIRDRTGYYSPGADSFGFSLYDTRPEDIGVYVCTYWDEFGTSVRSDGIKLKLQGYTFPTYVYTTATTTKGPVVSPTETVALGSIPGDTDHVKPQTSSSTQDRQDLTVVVGSAVGAGFGCLFLLLVILIPVILCQRKKKEPASLLRGRGAAGPSSNTCQASGYDEDRYSLYNTLRESIMLPDSVVLAGPSLPARDDTYNQAFEDTRRVTARPGALRQFSLPTTSTLPNQRCQPELRTDNRRRMIRSLSGPLDVEENEYLTPVSIRTAQGGNTVRYCNEASNLAANSVPYINSGNEASSMAANSVPYSGNEATNMTANSVPYCNTGNEASKMAGGNCDQDPAKVAAAISESICNNDSISKTPAVNQDIYTPEQPRPEESSYLQMGKDRTGGSDPNGDPYIAMTKESWVVEEQSAGTKEAEKEEEGIEYVNLARVDNCVVSPGPE